MCKGPETKQEHRNQKKAGEVGENEEGRSRDSCKRLEEWAEATSVRGPGGHSAVLSSES